MKISSPSRMCCQVAAVLFLAAAQIMAVDYFVDGASGNDANSGLKGAPFKTVGKAAGKARAGDTVFVGPGVYRESVRLRHSGTADDPIRFEASPAGGAVVTGADVVTEWSRVSGDEPIYLSPWPHVFAINHANGRPVEHHPADAPLWGRGEQVMADGRLLAPAASLAELRAKWRDHARERTRPEGSSVLRPPVAGLGRPFTGLFAVDTVNAKELYVWLSDGADPSGRAMEASVRGQVFGVNRFQSKEGVSDVEVSGFVFRHAASFPQRGGVTIHGTDNLVEDCVIEEMSGGGIFVSGVMRNCVVRNNGHNGGGAGGGDFVNSGCLWEGNSWKPISRNWEAAGYKLARVDGGRFEDCWFRKNGGPGLWFDIDVRNVLVTRCVFESNELSGLMVEISRDNRIVNNLAVGNAMGEGAAKAWGHGGIFLAESMNCLVTSNTCVANKDGLTFREQGPRPLKVAEGGSIPFHIEGNRVSRNIAADNRGFQLALWYDNPFFGMHPGDRKRYADETAWRRALKAEGKPDYDPRKQGLTIDANLYSSRAGEPAFLVGAPWRPGSRKLSGLPAYVAASGFDSGSVVGDPGFRNVAAGDYRTRATGPAARLQAGWTEVPGNLERWFHPRLPSFLR